jgi:ribonuclease HI
LLIGTFDGSTTKDNWGMQRSGIGFVIKDKDSIVMRKAKSIKGCTNYKAEYLALLELSRGLVELQPKGMVIIKGDCDSVIDHVNELLADPELGSANTHNKAHYGIAKEITKNLQSIPKFHPRLIWTARKNNKLADDLSGKASGRHIKYIYKRKNNRNSNRTQRTSRSPAGLFIKIEDSNGQETSRSI